MTRARTSLVLLCFAALGSACSGLYTNLDGGSGGGSGGSGGDGGGAGGSGGGSGGSGGGSGGSGGAGGGGGGVGGSGGGSGGGGGGVIIFPVATFDAGTWSRTAITIASPPSEYQDIVGLSETQFWVSDNAGRVTAYDNGTARIVHSDGTYPVDQLYLSPSGEVLAISDKRAAYCSANCLQPGTFQVKLSVTLTEHLGAVCGGNGVAYVIVNGSATRTIQLFQNGSFTPLESFATPDSPQSCFVLADGTLLITGAGDNVLRRDTDGGMQLEPIPKTQRSGVSPYWWDTTLYNGEVWASGQGRRLARRSAQGTWSIVYEGSDLYRFHAIHNAGGTLVTTGDESTVHNGAIVENNTVYLTADPTSFWGRGVFVASPNVHIVAGFENIGSSTGKIYKFTR
jgi:hypothetical protein